MLKALPWLDSIAQRDSTCLALDLRGAAIENALLLFLPVLLSLLLGILLVRAACVYEVPRYNGLGL